MNNTKTAVAAEGTAPRNLITHFWQVHYSLRPFTLVRHGDRLSVRPYSLGYFAVGTVAGYAAQCDEDVEAAIKRSRNRKENMQWINALASIIDNSGKTGAQKAMEGASQRAQLHELALGDLVWLEGHCFVLESDHNRNLKLTPVNLYFDGTKFSHEKI